MWSMKSCHERHFESKIPRRTVHADSVISRFAPTGACATIAWMPIPADSAGLRGATAAWKAWAGAAQMSRRASGAAGERMRHRSEAPVAPLLRSSRRRPRLGGMSSAPTGDCRTHELMSLARGLGSELLLRDS